MLVAVQFCQDSGLSLLILEGYVLQVVNLLAQETTNRSQAGAIIIDAKNMLNSFAVWSVVHVNKEGIIMRLIGLPRMLSISTQICMS